MQSEYYFFKIFNQEIHESHENGHRDRGASRVVKEGAVSIPAISGPANKRIFLFFVTFVYCVVKSSIFLNPLSSRLPLFHVVADPPHIRSTTSIPSRSSPFFKVLLVSSQSASRLARRSGDSALSTGHPS
jgi:hypothetical protein